MKPWRASAKLKVSTREGKGSRRKITIPTTNMSCTKNGCLGKKIRFTYLSSIRETHWSTSSGRGQFQFVLLTGQAKQNTVCGARGGGGAHGKQQTAINGQKNGGKHLSGRWILDLSPNKKFFSNLNTAEAMLHQT